VAAHAERDELSLLTPQHALFVAEPLGHLGGGVRLSHRFEHLGLTIPGVSG
jgi:hypothetical protein